MLVLSSRALGVIGWVRMAGENGSAQWGSRAAKSWWHFSFILAFLKCILFVGDSRRIVAIKVLTSALGRWDHKALLRYALLMSSVRCNG